MTPLAPNPPSYTPAMGERPGVSAVVPCFNEERRIVTTLHTLTAILDSKVPGAWEIVVVDDSSTDATNHLVQRRAAADPRVRIAVADREGGRSKGKGAAVRSGLLAATYDHVLVTDADLAGAPDQVTALLDAIGDAAAAIGTRVLPGAVIDQPRPLRRRAAAAVFRAFARRAGCVTVSDPQCGFKLFRRDAVRPHAAALVTDGFAYEVELLLRMQRAGLDVVEVPIRWSEGTASNVRVLADGLRMAGDVFRARRAVATAPSPAAPAGGDRGRPVLSVVMPVYNEAAVIEGVVKDVRKLVLDVAEADGGGTELVIVDDCGTDGSPDILARLPDDDARIRVLANPRNAGHGPSVRRGLDSARGEWLLQLDSDGQLDVADFAATWARRHDADLVVGVRRGRQDPLHRMLLTRAVNTVVSAIVRRRVVDANAGFKLISADLYRHLRVSIPPRTFAPSLLLVVGGHRARARVVNVAVTHRPRPVGTSSLRPTRLLRAVLTATWQTLRYAVTPVRGYR
jgi:dolichyl-phosphate beta-glucosyltransferase